MQNAFKTIYLFQIFYKPSTLNVRNTINVHELLALMWGHMCLGIRLTSVHAHKFKIEIYETFALTLNFFILSSISEDILLFLL